MSLLRRKQPHLCGIEKRTQKESYLMTQLPWRKRFLIKLDHSIRIAIDNPRSHLFFRTNTAILLEREKHKKSDFANVIHPFSTFRVYWEMLMMWVFLLYLIITPVLIAFYQKARLPVGMHVVDGAFDCICITDIIMTFLTGYAIDHTKEVVLNRRNIVTNYLLSIYFILDVSSSIPTELIMLVVWVFGWNTRTLTKYVQLANLLKVIRTRTLMIYMGRTAEVWSIHDLVVSIGRYCVLWALLMHWCGCIVYLLPVYKYGVRLTSNKNSWMIGKNIVKMSIFDKYMYCLFKAASQLFCISNKDYRAITTDEIILDIIFALIGYVMAGVALVLFLQLFFRLHTSNIKYHSIMNQLKQYMRHKQLPITMQKRLLDYYEYRFRETYFRENTIFPTISERLRRDMNTYVCMKLIKSVPLLKDLPPLVRVNIVPCLRPEVFLPNDIIIKAGTIGDCMYFIHSGTVAVYTPTGKEVCHLQDGGYFGEMSLIAKDSKRIANVVAIETTEVYRLERKNFNGYLKTLPELYKKLERIADSRRENTLVMEEIHRKHILEKTMRMIDDR